MKKNLFLATAIIMTAGLTACGITEPENTNVITDIVVETPEVDVVEPSDIEEPTPDDIQNEEPEIDPGDAPEIEEESGYGDPVDEDEQINELIDSLRQAAQENEVYETLYENKTTLEMIPDIEGTWNRTQVHSAFSATVDVTNVSEIGFDYYVEAYYYMNMGMLEGQAYFVNENTAISQVSLGWADDTTEQEWIVFCFERDQMYAYPTGYGADLGFGMNVGMEGCYTLDDPAYINSMILEDTFLEEELTAVSKAMSDEEYENFIFLTENGAVTAERDSDGYLTYVETILPGMGGYTITFDQGKVVSYSF